MINLALVGVGKWGKNFLTTVDKVSDCRIKYVCAKTQNTLQNLSDSFSKTILYEELFEKKDLHGVIIASPAVTHFRMAYDFISHGIPVLVEKPFTTNLIEAIKLENHATKLQVPLMVGHEFVYNPAFQVFKRILSEIGSVKYIYTEAGNYGPFRPDISCLWDWGPHDVAMLIDLFQLLPQTVQAWITGEDIVIARLVFNKTVDAFININRLMHTKIRTFNALSRKISIRYDEFAKQKLTFYSYQPVMNNSQIKPMISYPDYDLTPALQKEVETFVQIIQNRKHPNLTNGSHAVLVIKILEALENSSNNSGKAIEIH